MTKPLPNTILVLPFHTKKCISKYSITIYLFLIPSSLMFIVCTASTLIQMLLNLYFLNIYIILIYFLYRFI